MVTIQVVAVPTHAPDQPPNAKPVPGAALSVTWLPVGKRPLQCFGQLIPAGLLVTSPVPGPVKLMDSLTGGGPVNDAFTNALALSVSVHGSVPKQAPDHPSNDVLAAGVAVSTTWVPGLNDAEHVPGQLIPAGELVTVPTPLPISETVNCDGPL